MRIEVDGGERLILTWDDDTVDTLTALELRRLCPCASCREDPAAGRDLLHGVDPVRIADARLVGGYALNLTFSPDGHATGIYSFSYLRSLDA